MRSKWSLLRLFFYEIYLNYLRISSFLITRVIKNNGVYYMILRLVHVLIHLINALIDAVMA